MRGYLSLVNQRVVDPAATEPVHRHRSSLLDLGSRDMDEGQAMDIGKESLKAAKEEALRFTRAPFFFERLPDFPECRLSITIRIEIYLGPPKSSGVGGPWCS